MRNILIVDWRKSDKNDHRARNIFVDASLMTLTEYPLTAKTVPKENLSKPNVIHIFIIESMQVSDISHHAPLGKSDHSLITFDFHCYLDFIKRKVRYCFERG